jgi:hypothetical protein
MLLRLTQWRRCELMLLVTSGRRGEMLLSCAGVLSFARRR